MKGENKIIGAKITHIEQFDDYIHVYLDNGMALEVAGIESVKEVKDWENFVSPNIKSKIYNVSPESKIECFPKIDYQTFFTKLNET